MMVNEKTTSEALETAIDELDEAVKCVNMFERMIQQMDSVQLEGDALDGLRQILYRVVCASDAVCRLTHPEWKRYRDDSRDRAVAISEAVAEAKAVSSQTAPTDYDTVPGRDC